MIAMIYFIFSFPRLVQNRVTGFALFRQVEADAFALFLQHFTHTGTQPREYQAKLFGGGNMFVGEPGRSPEIVARNIECGKRFLSQYNIPLISSHVGGSGRRKLHFDLWTGNVWVAFPAGEGADIHNIQDKAKHG